MARHLHIQDFTYLLPEERIALYPLPERDSSRLLVYREGQIQDDVFRHLANHLPPGAMLVLNNTKVVEARLLFQTASGAQVELFYLEPEEAVDQTRAMARPSPLTIKCYVGKAKKWKTGEELVRVMDDPSLTIRAQQLGKTGDHYTVRLDWTPAHHSFAEVLHAAGQIPLPPYIRRETESSDAHRYQTVYARHRGSVAAPTAGLHFTDGVLQQLEQKGVQIEPVTLHVGAGTFKPVQAGTMAEHFMHGEYMDVPVALIRALAAQHPRPVVAVGTTAMRTLESLYWLGVQTLRSPHTPVWGGQVEQFEPYDAPSDTPAAEALLSLAKALEQNGAGRLMARTHLMIAPGYRFRVVDGLVTNFHQPQSTLLLLVAAFIGPDWKRVYGHALANGYRFLSYGDSSLLWKAG